MSRVGIIGCGNIGYRHLQALAAVSEIETIHVVEPHAPRREACTVGELRPETAAVIVGHATPSTLPPGPWSLLVSAVTADVAPEVDLLLGRLEFEALLLEKPLCQRAADLDAVEACFEQAADRVLVNCPRGLWSGYQDLHAQLASHPRVAVEITGNLWGFGCNAVHMLELFRYLIGGTLIRSVSAQLHAAPGGSKRGERFEEFVGTASFVSERGDTLQLTCGNTGAAPLGCVVVVRNPNAGVIAIADEPCDALWLSRDGEFKAQALGMLPVSRSTGAIYAGRGAPATLDVPRLLPALATHRAFFDGLTAALDREAFRIT